VIAVLGLMTVLFAHPVFSIDRIEITGVEHIAHPEMEGLITSYLAQPTALFFNRQNRFLFSDDALAEKLEAAFALSSISVTLQEGTILIDLVERTSNLFWMTQNRLYVVDLDGIVVREIADSQDSVLNQASVKELPTFRDKNDVGVSIGSSVLTAEEIDQAFRFLTSLQTVGITYTLIEIDRLAGKWVRLITQTGYSILFDLTGDIREQFQNLLVVLGNQEQNSAELEYIDLRFGDKVYLK
jgi:cell division septal protein FtsQ